MQQDQAFKPSMLIGLLPTDTAAPCAPPHPAVCTQAAVPKGTPVVKPQVVQA
jgi:hypothetical protein